METDALVRDYIARLEAAAVRLPAGRRAELVDEVRGHIEAAIAAEPTSGEAAVRNVLDRLGKPEVIVGAEIPPGDASFAAATTDMSPTVTAERPGIGPLEVVAVLLVTVGAFFVPIIGPAIGIVLVWMSRAWSTRWKLVITLVVLVVVLLPIVGLMSAGGAGGVIQSSPVPVQ